MALTRITGKQVLVKQAGVGAVVTDVQTKLREFVSVKDFGAVGNGVADDTAAINACISANLGKRIYFPAGTYRYSGGGAVALTAGTVVVGASRKATKIVSITAAPPSLFYCEGYGSGVESMAFDAEVVQTGGCYVFLGGPESYISDFFMTNDFRGVIMFGNVSQIREGRFKDAAPNAIRIDCGGGDNSQSINNVLMGAQTPPNIAKAGIRLQNCVALTMHNVSVIQQNVGLLIDPTSTTGPVLNLFASQCFFDNCTFPILISPSAGGAVRRLYFTDVWASSGVNGVTIDPTSGATVKGIHFTNLQANLNTGSGVSVAATGVSELTFDDGVASGNRFGFFFGGGINAVRISNMNIGAFDDFAANTLVGINFNGSGYTNVQVVGNNVTGNTVGAISGEASLGAGSRVTNNIGIPGTTSAISVGASPFTYTAGPRDETVYITGGTVSLVSVNGVGVHQASEVAVYLRAHSSMQVMYSSAPFMNTSKHD